LESWRPSASHAADTVNQSTPLDSMPGMATEAQLDQCANTARLTSLECRLACTGDVDEERLACSQAQSACLGACASCGTPQQCPAD